MAASLSRRTAAGMLWLLSGAGMQAALQLLVVAVLARLLTPYEFGVVGAAVVVVGFVQVFGTLGVGPALVQGPELDAPRLRTAFTISLIMSVIAAALVYACAGGIAAFFRTPDLVPVVRALAVVFPLTGIGMCSQALLQREMRFKALAAVQVWSFGVGYGAVGIYMAWRGFGVWALVGAQIGQVFVSSLLYLAYRPDSMRPGFDARALRELLGFGGGYSLSLAMNQTAMYLDKLIVGRWLGAEPLGIYGRAYQFLMLPTLLFGRVVDRALFPALASVQDDRARLGRAYQTGLGAIALVILPLSAVLIALTPEIVAVTLGDQWGAVVPVFRIMAVALVFRIGYKLSVSLVMATAAVYRNAVRQGIYMVLMSGGAWAGHFFGLEGVAVGVAAAIVVHFLLMLHLGIRVSGASWPPIAGSFARAAVIAALVGGAAWAASELARGFDLAAVATLAVGLAAASCIVGIALVVPRALLGEEALWLERLVRR